MRHRNHHPVQPRPGIGPVLLLIHLGLLLSALAACRTAKYEIVGPEEVKGTEPPVPPCDDCTANYEPSADLIAMLDGKTVTAVPAGKEVTITATADTMDPDDFGKDGSCPANPGIVTSSYVQAEEGIDRKIQRTSCESLAIKHTFAKAGLYFIELEATSNEDEHAMASMTLAVYDPADQKEAKGFDIEANPIIVTIGEEITFTSNCEDNHQAQTKWIMGDGGTSSGPVVKYTYSETGSFEVTATCKKMRASVTVVVLPKDHEVPTGKPPITKPGVKPPTTNPGQTGPQNPGQQNPGQQSPGQQGAQQN